MSSIQAGDVVVCVAREFNYCTNHDGHAAVEQKHGVAGLRTGTFYTVIGITPAIRCSDGGLLLAELTSPNRAGFCAGRFRKVEKAAPGFIAQIKACRPKQRDRVSS